MSDKCITSFPSFDMPRVVGYTCKWMLLSFAEMWIANITSWAEGVGQAPGKAWKQIWPSDQKWNTSPPKYCYP